MENIFADSHWLHFDTSDANVARTVFSAKDIPVKATLYITALGYFEPYINGKSITDDKYIPAMTDYEKRDLSKIHMPIYDTFSHRIYYYEYDITDFVNKGENIMVNHIGAGWYGQHKSKNEGMPKWGDNTLVFTVKLSYSDDTEEFIRSSADNTKYKTGYIISSSLYFGEIHDYNLYEDNFGDLSYNDENLIRCTEREKPDSLLCPADFPADRILRTIKPKLISKFGDRKIYDIGETASGYAVVKFTTDNCDVTAETRYADTLNEDGSLQFYYCGGTSRMQKDVFISSRNCTKECYPHFTWHAARYIELTGDAEITEYRLVSTPLEQISSFSGNNETLNWYYEAYLRTQIANTHGCIPSDCPHRERLGYTGDGQLACGAVMSSFDARDMYKKWLRDIRDCQDKEGGHIQHTAPFYGGGGGPGGWGGAACIVPWRYYEFYADKDVLSKSYNSMKSYIKYMVSRLEDGLITHEEKGGWCLGDWCPPMNKIEIPETFVNTYYLSKCSDICLKTAKILNVENDIRYFEEIRNNANASIVSHFYNSVTHSFCNGVQGADAFALDIGLGDETTVDNLAKKYQQAGQFDTGIFGTDLLIRMLFAKGYSQLAFDLLTNEKEISFYNMKKGGATTLWENWNGCDSRCHPMFGAATEYIFSGILGIRQPESSYGFSEVTVNPPEIKGLDNYSGTFGTPNGKITVTVTTVNGERKTEIKAENIKIMPSE